MHKITTTLAFDGRCEAAFEFYEQHLDAKIEFVLRWGDSPLAEQVSSEFRDKVLHARLKIGDSALVGGDVPPKEYKKPQGVSVLLGIDDPATAERTFRALAEGGTVIIPLREAFWAFRYGMVIDQFGIPWEVNCERPP
jgi:PhnB protein